MAQAHLKPGLQKIGNHHNFEGEFNKSNEYWGVRKDSAMSIPANQHSPIVLEEKGKIKQSFNQTKITMEITGINMILPMISSNVNYINSIIKRNKFSY